MVVLDRGFRSMDSRLSKEPEGHDVLHYHIILSDISNIAEDVCPLRDQPIHNLGVGI
jgi:hypothetical protein